MYLNTFEKSPIFHKIFLKFFQRNQNPEGRAHFFWKTKPQRDSPLRCVVKICVDYDSCLAAM
ncbi:MAG: hypothetical protein EGR91_07500 [Lachnospiraceae bacterium]|nr:hypothetical protein [Lachnospiraceae bacterium]